VRDRVITNLRQRFASYADLVDGLDDEALVEQVDVPKHKSIQQHLWCVVGARESYARALRAGRWNGFACSMSAYSKDDFSTSLESSSREVLDALAAIENWTAEHDELLASLAEHEVMHEGQIIRHVYGVGGTLPSSWKWA
jgi:hypothetical protein